MPSFWQPFPVPNDKLDEWFGAQGYTRDQNTSSSTLTADTTENFPP